MAVKSKGMRGESFLRKKQRIILVTGTQQDDSGQILFGCRLRHISVGTVNELELYDEKDVLVFTKGGYHKVREKKILFPAT